MNKPPSEKIKPRAVRYIKLGRGGKWEDDCLEKSIIRFGFETGDPHDFERCQRSEWQDVAEAFRKAGHSKGTATRFTNEIQTFFDDTGDILWITFMRERLYWGFLTPAKPKMYGDGSSTFRNVDGGWRHMDLFGDELAKSRLPGSITKLAAYRGTSCNVDSAEKVVTRINGKKLPHVERCGVALQELNAAIVPLIQELGPKDFEVLVDLIFSVSGWRRVGSIGKAQKTLDLDLELPTTREKAYVQVKCRTTQAEFDDYAKGFASFETYQRMFYVFHTGQVRGSEDNIIIVGPNEVAEMAINAGLTNWIMEKV